MGLSVADANVVHIQREVADGVLDTIEDGHDTGNSFTNEYTIYPETEGLAFRLTTAYRDQEGGYTVHCVFLNAGGRDVTTDYIEGVVDVIRGQISSMDVEIQPTDGTVGVTLVFTVRR